MVPMIFNMVVLPPPEVPNIVKNSPFFTFKDTPLKAGTPSIPIKYVLCIFLRTITSCSSLFFEFSSVSCFCNTENIFSLFEISPKYNLYSSFFLLSLFISESDISFTINLFE